MLTIMTGIGKLKWTVFSQLECAKFKLCNAKNNTKTLTTMDTMDRSLEVTYISFLV